VGKRIEDLSLDDTLIPDDRDQEWYQFGVEIDDLLATGDYDWAEETLSGIHTTVERTRQVTAAQRRAVSNIENAREQQQQRRRYEGWRGRER
jgi:hypothetical protein